MVCIAGTKWEWLTFRPGRFTSSERYLIRTRKAGLAPGRFWSILRSEKIFDPAAYPTLIRSWCSSLFFYINNFLLFEDIISGFPFLKVARSPQVAQKTGETAKTGYTKVFSFVESNPV
jgi:hypothetical protein